jgi:predicted O-methyltransferase YrrM
MEMTPSRWAYTCDYLREVFGRQDQTLQTLMPRAVAAGVPDIAVSADVGRLLMILTQLSVARKGGKPGLAVELGTLAGYSGIWLARGLGAGGKLITIEAEPKHADFAGKMFKEAGVGDRVDVRIGNGLDVLPQLVKELGPGSVDVLFLDAIKTEYPDYFRVAKPLIAVGGLIIADNVLGAGTWWIDEPKGKSEQRDGADRFNRIVAADADFEAAAAPIREGVMVARRIR